MDRKPRISRSILAAPTFALLAVFWAQGAIDPLTAAALVVDRALGGLTLVLLVALILVWTNKGWAKPLWIVIGAVGLLVSVAVLAGGAFRPTRDLLMMLVAAVALAGALTLIITSGDDLPRVAGIPTKVLALAGAVAMPLLELFTGAAFLPSRTEATLTQTVEVVLAEAMDDKFRATLQYKAENPTDTRVLVVVSRLTTCWWRPGVTPLYRDQELLKRDNCRATRPVGSTGWISPESNLTFSASYKIPIGSPRVTTVARVAFARGDRLRTGEGFTDYGQLGQCYHVHAVRLLEESRLEAMAERPKYLVYADRDGDGGVSYYFDSGPNVECPSGNPNGVSPDEAPLRGSGDPSVFDDAATDPQSLGPQPTPNPDSESPSVRSGDDAELRRYFGVTEQRQLQDVWLTPPKGK
jgi:hypothetical protein